MIALAIILALLVASYLTYRNLPILSQPWRVKLLVSRRYPSEGHLQLVLVPRFKRGNWPYDNRNIDLAYIDPRSDKADDELAAALSDAQQRLAVVRATERQAAMIGRVR